MEQDTLFITEYESPIGTITLAGDGFALRGLWFNGQRYDRAGCGLLLTAGEKERELFALAETWLDAYFAGHRPEMTLPLAPRGTEFQKRVWAELLKIPYGRTQTYGEIAKALGCPSARAVGTAVGRNPISLLIPCHRVVGAGGKLTGYAGGLERKKFLLRLETEQ